MTDLSWQEDFSTAERLAREQRRPLLIDFWDPG